MYMGYVSLHQDHTMSKEHNRRDKDYIEKEKENHAKKSTLPFHIDETRTKENLYYTQDLKEFYHDTFQAAVDAYDEKQRKKHPDRVKGDYYTYIQKHQREAKAPKLCYEMIVQYGDRNLCQSDEARTRCKEALLDYVRSFQQRNPMLAVVGAYLHMDEASPHVHLDYVPIAYSKRGIAVQNSRNLALKQQEEKTFGTFKDSYSENAVTRWQERERQVLREIAKKHSLEVETEKKPTKKEHEETRLYALQKENRRLTAENRRIKRESEVKLKTSDKLAADTIRQGQEEAERLIAEARQKAEAEKTQLIISAQKEADTIRQDAYIQSQEDLQAAQSRLTEVNKEIAAKEQKKAKILDNFEAEAKRSAYEVFKQEGERLVNKKYNELIFDKCRCVSEDEVISLVEDGKKYRELEIEHEYDD